ncbi:hypothetical protein HUA78_28485 [Myxococcus sp. CA033]|uniref:hypothetical protein n=1 Tax=Myxococcus sp. CA033 TaxID=2741516 RepID=UPI00157B91AD|nr:hypothetical protein [Myxococcus sp. CA033]NTX38390.1 hypothetical protein [Myxococcus sp. CA033]
MRCGNWAGVMATALFTASPTHAQMEPQAVSPLACLLTASHGALRIHFEINRCYVSESGTVNLILTPFVAKIEGGYDSGLYFSLRVSQRTLSPIAGYQMVRELVDAATQQETAPDCGDNGSYRAALEWSCDTRSTAGWQTTALSAPTCYADIFPDLPYGTATHKGTAVDTKAEEPFYMRAYGIHRVANRMLQEALR